MSDKDPWIISDTYSEYLGHSLTVCFYNPATNDSARVTMPPGRWFRAYQLLLEDDVTRDVMTDKKD